MEKIYVMKEREAIFFIALSNLTLLARMCTLVQPNSLGLMNTVNSIIVFSFLHGILSPSA